MIPNDTMQADKRNIAGSKEIDGVDDQKVDIETVAVSTNEKSGREDGEGGSDNWTTSRLELWAFYFYYIVCTTGADILPVASFIKLIRATTAYLDSITVHLNSKISSSSLDMIQASLHSLLPVVQAAAYCHSWEKSETVRRYLGVLSSTNSFHLTVNSIVLVTNGISFAIQAVLFIIIGAWADYGRWRPNITIMFTLLAVGVSFAWLGVEDASRWKPGIALYILGRESNFHHTNIYVNLYWHCCYVVIAYQGALTFWTAAFPGLTRDLPEVKESLR